MLKDRGTMKAWLVMFQREVGDFVGTVPAMILSKNLGSGQLGLKSQLWLTGNHLR